MKKKNTSKQPKKPYSTAINVTFDDIISASVSSIITKHKAQKLVTKKSSKKHN